MALIHGKQGNMATDWVNLGATVRYDGETQFAKLSTYSVRYQRLWKLSKSLFTSRCSSLSACLFLAFCRMTRPGIRIVRI